MLFSGASLAAFRFLRRAIKSGGKKKKNHLGGSEACKPGFYFTLPSDSARCVLLGDNASRVAPGAGLGLSLTAPPPPGWRYLLRTGSAAGVSAPPGRTVGGRGPGLGGAGLSPSCGLSPWSVTQGTGAGQGRKPWETLPPRACAQARSFLEDALRAEAGACRGSATRRRAREWTSRPFFSVSSLRPRAPGPGIAEGRPNFGGAPNALHPQSPCVATSCRGEAQTRSEICPSSCGSWVLHFKDEIQVPVLTYKMKAFFFFFL